MSSLAIEPWTDFERAHHPVMTDVEKREHARRIHLETGLPLQEILEHMASILLEEEVWVNSRYQVNVRHDPGNGTGPMLIHLSIKRRDKRPVGSERYRDFMAIKDFFVGAECEGLEIYPARSREVDTATQYHLWCMADPTWRVPFGYKERKVMDGDGTVAPSGAVQNAMEAHHHR